MAADLIADADTPAAFAQSDKQNRGEHHGEH
jgi:hypothetical protein